MSLWRPAATAALEHLQSLLSANESRHSPQGFFHCFLKRQTDIELSLSLVFRNSISFNFSARNSRNLLESRLGKYRKPFGTGNVVVEQTRISTIVRKMPSNLRGGRQAFRCYLPRIRLLPPVSSW